MRVVASADILRTHNGKKSLTDDVFVGLDGNEQSIGITPFAPTLRNESYEARRQTYLKAIENLLGIKRGILSDAEAVSKTATEINFSAVLRRPAGRAPARRPDWAGIPPVRCVGVEHG